MAKTQQEIIEELKSTPDIDPYKHDGSYELVQKAVELYGRKQNLGDVDYNDLNLIYFLTVGTWTYGIEKKKELVKISHLSEDDKKVFLDFLDFVWAKAKDGKYENKVNGKPSVGMVGTGFKTFKDKCGNDDIKKFIQMCVDISEETSNEKATKNSSADYEKAFDIAGQVLNSGIKGMRAATCSIILHCLRPYIFPILNSNNYVYKALDLNIKSTKLKDIKEYVNNCRVITEYMRNYDIFCNYRKIDLFSGREVFDEETLISNKEVNRDEKSDVFNVSKPQLPVNMILYGPPGTGKTYNSVVYAVGIIENKSKEEIEKYIKTGKTQENQTESTEYSEILKKFNDYKVKHDIKNDNQKDGQIEFVTFHQSYGYEEFIEGIKPRTENGEIRYEIADGVFKKFCKKAESNRDKNYVFVIDEINRGNISKIFGELITLIEDTKRIGASEEMRATLPYSGESFGVPENVYILGTMNTADRSISLMDTALRRRFRFVEMMPNPALINAEIDGSGNKTEVNKKLSVQKILETMNKRIEYLYDREHTIGHSFFMKLNETRSMDDLKNVMLNSVLPLLQEYFYDDYNKIRLVLGDNQKSEADDNTCFVVKKKDYNKNDLFGATDEINDTEVFEINEKAFGEFESYNYLSDDTGSVKHDQSGTDTLSENN